VTRADGLPVAMIGPAQEADLSRPTFEPRPPNVPRRSVIVGIYLLLTAIWGTTWAAIRIGLAGIPPVTGVALRFGIAAAVLLVLARVRGVRLGHRTHERRLWLVLAAFSFGLPYIVVYWAEQWVPSGLASIFYGTFPLAVALLAHFTLDGDRLSIRGAFGALVGFAGVVVIFSEDLSALAGPGVRHAALVLLTAPLASAIAYVATKRWGKAIPPLSLTAVPMAMTAVVVGGLAAVVERGRPIVWSPAAVLALLYLAVVGSAVTFTLYYGLLAVLPATRLATIAFTAPVVAVLVGIFAFDEPMTIRIATGALLVLGGVATTVMRRPDAPAPTHTTRSIARP